MSSLDLAIKRSMLSFQEEQQYQDCLEFSKQPIWDVKGKTFKEQNVLGDGNCLFRCIAIEMYGDEKHHALVRQSMINFVQQNKHNYQSSANLSEPIDRWIGKMSNCGSKDFGLMGEFGDAFALELLSWMLERPIIVSLRDLYSDNLLYEESIGNWFQKSPILLNLRGQHYTLLV
jgi:hypothetical protein